MKNNNIEIETTNAGIDGGNAIEEDDYEPVISLRECPHLDINEVCQEDGDSNGYESWCQECEAWVENDAHIRTVRAYLRHQLIKSSDSCNCCEDVHFHADTTHLENIVEYIQSHLHHQDNTWGQDGLHYLWG